MKKIIAFAGSNSKNSINKQLVEFAADLIENVDVTVLDLNDFKLPIYGVDLEKEMGIPDNAHRFLNYILETDGIVLALAEHNGNYATVFKNLFDWMSRINGKFWSDKPMFLMATSPGGRGGASVLEVARKRFPYMGGNIVAEFSLPLFNENFSKNKIKDKSLNKEFQDLILNFSKFLS